MSMQPEPEPQVIDLRGFFGVLRTRKWSILLMTLLVTGIALGLVYQRTPQYAATAEVSVQPRFSVRRRPQGFYFRRLREHGHGIAPRDHFRATRS